MYTGARREAGRPSRFAEEKRRYAGGRDSSREDVLRQNGKRINWRFFSYVLHLPRQWRLEKENATSITQLENSVNLDEIYASATGKLGMKAAKKGRVFTYKSRKSTQVRQHGKIPVK